MHHDLRSTVLALSLVAAVLSACGGDSSSADPDTSPAVVETTIAQSDTTVTTVADTAAATTTPSIPDVTFDGVPFVEAVEEPLAAYSRALADPASIGAVLPSFGADVPLPVGAAAEGIGRVVEVDLDSSVNDEQYLTFGLALDEAGLEAFGRGAPAEWTNASFATSGSLNTLLLTHADGRRAVYVTDAEATSTSPRPPLEAHVTPLDSTLVAPVWVASLPVMEGGTVVDYAEFVGRGTENLLGGAQFVSVRVRYSADALDELTAYLESGIVQAAGFQYDLDTFNGFEQLVDVAAGDWTGQVLIGSANVNGVDYYDLVWALGR